MRSLPSVRTTSVTIQALVTSWKRWERAAWRIWPEIPCSTRFAETRVLASMTAEITLSVRPALRPAARHALRQAPRRRHGLLHQDPYHGFGRGSRQQLASAL